MEQRTLLHKHTICHPHRDSQACDCAPALVTAAEKEKLLALPGGKWFELYENEADDESLAS